MIITVQKMKEVFAYCNKTYFEGKLARPKLSTSRSANYIARVYCIPNYETRRCGGIEIKFSELFDFNEEQLISVMCHEMIHLSLYRRFIIEKEEHGPRWHKMADEIKEKYGLDIETLELPKQVVKQTLGGKIKDFIFDTFFYRPLTK